MAKKDIQHNSLVSPNQPQWGQVDKTRLPLVAFANMDTAPKDKKTEWKYPHHWVEGGNLGDNGVYENGQMWLHTEGLNAAWAAANGARSGETAPKAILDHLNEHRMKLQEAEQPMDDGKAFVPDMVVKAVADAKLVTSISVDQGENDQTYPYGYIEGYASVFNVTDSLGDIIRRGAFAKTIQERVAAGKVFLMIKHMVHGGDSGETVGIIREAKEDDYGLWYKAALYPSQQASELRAKVMMSPAAFGSSVGFKPIKKGTKRITTGREFSEVALYEVTITTLPANEMTSAVAKSAIEAVIESVQETKQVLDGINERLERLEKGDAEQQTTLDAGEDAPADNAGENDAEPKPENTDSAVDNAEQPAPKVVDRTYADKVKQAKLKLAALKAETVDV